MRFRFLVLTTLACLLGSVRGAPAQGARADVVASLSPYVSPAQQIAIGDGRFIHIVCMGHGSPTVILSAGAADWSAGWLFVQPAIAKKTKVCAWDRAGNGFSGGSKQPQDIFHTEHDLELALDEAGLSGPLVMVGHSLGALEILRFADLHKDRVAGMVLVDPSFPNQAAKLAHAAPALMAFSDQSDQKALDWVRRCLEALKLDHRAASSTACTDLRANYPEPLRTSLLNATNNLLYWQTYLSLFKERNRSFKLAINANRHDGELPIILLTSGVLTLPGAPAEIQKEIPAVQAAIKRGHDDMARLSSQQTNVFVADSGHAIQIDKPAIVIDSINSVIEKARAGGAAVHQ